MMNRSEYFTVKRLRFLDYLIERGFEPEYDMPDPTNPKYRWWKFKHTPEFEEARVEYFAMIKGNK